MNVPNALNWTGLGAALGTQVVVAAGRGVNVGVVLGVGVGGKVAVAGGPCAIVMALSVKPGPEVAVGAPLLPPPQLRRIAPNTNNTTGVTTSHLSHRDNIKQRAMTVRSRAVKLARDYSKLT